MKKLLILSCLLLLFIPTVSFAGSFTEPDIGTHVVQFTSTDATIQDVPTNVSPKAEKAARVLEAQRIVDSIDAANPQPRAALAEPDTPNPFKLFFADYWKSILGSVLGFALLYTGYTASKRDDSIISIILRFLNLKPPILNK